MIGLVLQLSPDIKRFCSNFLTLNYCLDIFLIKDKLKLSK